ncbi:MAG: SDR family NAD(P)-dependent oxidoreductase, partial [Myxococcota bacterium]
MKTDAMKGVAFDFTQKTVLVTGASKGIGQGIALRFAEAGASVVVGYRTGASGASATVAAIEAEGGAAVSVAMDAVDRSSFEAAINVAVDRFGRLDVLVNNAGVYPLQPLSEMD